MFPGQKLASQRLLQQVPLAGRTFAENVSTATSLATTVDVVAGGTANTKGSWATLLAATPFRASELLLSAYSTTGVSGTERLQMMDIAIGPSGAPDILVNNLQVGALSNGSRYETWRIPLRIPSGSEIIARSQSPVTGATIPWAVETVGDRGGVPAYSECTTYGADTDTTHGVVLATPAGTNTKGAWTEVVASTTTYIRALGWGLGFEWQPGWSTLNFLFDIGIGSAGNEVALFENLVARTSTSEIVYGWLPTDFAAPVAVDLPIGTRLSARFQASGTNQDLDIVLYGWS